MNHLHLTLLCSEVNAVVDAGEQDESVDVSVAASKTLVQRPCVITPAPPASQNFIKTQQMKLQLLAQDVSTSLEQSSASILYNLPR